MKLFRCLLVFVGLASLSSCSITERIIFKEDGSGKYAYEVDGSKVMAMMGSAIKEESAKKSKKKKKGKKGERESMDMDSTFTFRELFAEKRDSISKLPLDEQAKLKQMENFSMRIVMNEEKGLMNYSMFTDFKSISELSDMNSPMQSMKSLNSANKSLGEKGAMNDDNVNNYVYDGKTFKKTVRKTAVEQSVKDSEISPEAQELAEGMKESMSAIYEESDFKVVYEFPKAVKKISHPNAEYSSDRKTVTVVFGLKEYMENPESLNLEVELE